MIATSVNLAVDDREGALNQALLYPLRFDPIYQYRLWGGRHLARETLNKVSLSTGI
jgi:hypothetical protein